MAEVRDYQLQAIDDDGTLTLMDQDTTDLITLPSPDNPTLIKAEFGKDADGVVCKVEKTSDGQKVVGWKNMEK